MPISLDLSTRANLYALQTTQSLLGRTSRRISTGLRVAKPSDDSQAYFAAEALNVRVTQYTIAKSNIEQTSYALEAALSGLEGISRLLDNISGVLSNLSNAQNAIASERLRSQYNQLLTQIDNLADATAYQGVNLINNGVMTLNVSFSGAYGQNDLTISAVRSDSAGLVLSTVAAGQFFQAMTTLASQDSRNSLPSVASIASMASRAQIFASPAMASQDSIPSVVSIGSVASQPSTASNASVQSTPSQSSQPSVASVASQASRASQAALNAASSTPSTLSAASVASVATIPSLQSIAGVTTAAVNNALISGIAQQLVNAKASIAATQATIGIINDVLLVRTEFSKNYVLASQNQIAALTAATLNEETANLKALQTAQMMGLQALTVSTSARSNLLRLF